MRVPETVVLMLVVLAIAQVQYGWFATLLVVVGSGAIFIATLTAADTEIKRAYRDGLADARQRAEGEESR